MLDMSAVRLYIVDLAPFEKKIGKFKKKKKGGGEAFPITSTVAYKLISLKICNVHFQN